MKFSRTLVAFMLITTIFSSCFMVFAGPSTPPVVNDANINGTDIIYSDSSLTANTTTDFGPGKMTLDGLVEAGSTEESFWQLILTKYKLVISVVAGLGTLTFVLFFILNFIKLGKTSDSPQARSSCIGAIIMTGIGAAGCGGVLVVMSAFYNLFT